MQGHCTDAEQVVHILGGVRQRGDLLRLLQTPVEADEGRKDMIPSELDTRAEVGDLWGTLSTALAAAPRDAHLMAYVDGK